MRIAFFVNEFPALSQTFILNQITGMIDRGHEVDIYAQWRFDARTRHAVVDRYALLEKCRYLSEVPVRAGERLATAWRMAVRRGLLRRPGLVLRFLFGWERPRELLNLRAFYTLFSCLDRRPYDIIHCQFGTLGPLALTLRKLGVIDGTLVTAFRGYDITCNVDGNAERYRRLFEDGEYFLPVSHSLAGLLRAAGCPEKRMQILHSGIDCHVFRFRARTLTPGEPLQLLSIGRFVEKKGLRYALQAVAGMHRSGCQLRYTIVGDGELRLQIEQQISLLGMQDVVTLAGWCNHEQVVEQIHAAHLLIAPSVTASNGDQEGIPNVVKEAMATGLPVLTTRHGGIPELVEDGVNGYLVAEGDAAALEERLQHFVESPDEATALSRHARVKIEAEFDSEKINDALERLYLNLAGARK